eukprot:gene16078-681_t
MQTQSLQPTPSPGEEDEVLCYPHLLLPMLSTPSTGEEHEYIFYWRNMRYYFCWQPEQPSQQNGLSAHRAYCDPIPWSQQKSTKVSCGTVMYPDIHRNQESGLGFSVV